MRFLCDVHITYKLVNQLIFLGFETIHINHILDKWNTSDKDIARYADSNDLIIITKDKDFRNSFFIKGTPKKLIKVNLGNISNQELINSISDNIEAIKKISKASSFLIEMDKGYITFTENKKFGF